MSRVDTSSPHFPPGEGETVQGIMRLEYAGKWLAWTEDESRIVAVGDTVEEVRSLAERAGHPRFIYDWVPPTETRQTSGPT